MDSASRAGQAKAVHTVPHPAIKSWCPYLWRGLSHSRLPGERSSILPKAGAVAGRSFLWLEEADFWTTLNHQRLEFLRTEIKPLFRTVSETDFKAMRFERDLLEYSLARLSEEKGKAEILKAGIVEQIHSAT